MVRAGTGGHRLIGGLAGRPGSFRTGFDLATLTTGDGAAGNELTTRRASIEIMRSDIAAMRTG